uniref:Uncharacterized protein n=1 Tax=Hippocampus comes TaxID=109280 RepID=A0A3Q2YRG2_HIPCM
DATLPISPGLGPAGKKPIRVKTMFTSPFALNWSPLPQKDMHFILTTLKDKLISMGLEKKEVKVFRPWRKKQRGPDFSSMDTDTNKVEDSSKGGWTDVAARRQLALGINEVTKGLERNQLKLVLSLTVCCTRWHSNLCGHFLFEALQWRGKGPFFKYQFWLNQEM